MLNEGYALYKSLERCGIPLLLHNPNISKPGKNNGLIIGLNKKGEVASIEFRDKKQMSQLWTIRDSKKNSFPAMKLKKRLLNFESASKKELESLLKTTNIEIVKTFWLEHGTNHKSVIADWKSVVNKIKELELNKDLIPADGMAYMDLLDRMKKLSEAKPDENKNVEIRVASEIVEAILINLEKGLLQFDQAKEFLFKEKPETFLFFDVSDYEKYNIRVASPSIKSFVSDYLFKIEKSSTEGVCALLGKSTFIEDDKFPEPSLPKFGPTKIFSMNKDALCHFRYGNISTKIIPIGKTVTYSIQSALEWITHPDQEKKTWSMVPSGQVETRNGKKIFKDDLLLVYLENKPNLNVNKAHLLNGMSKVDFSESTFEAIAKEVIGTLEKGKDVNVNDQVRLFVLRKADKDRRQVALQRRYNVGEIIGSAKSWQRAAENIPNISLIFYRQEFEKITSEQKNIPKLISDFLENKESKEIYLSPRCPFPADLVRLTQKQWIRLGEDNYSVSGVSLGEVYDIFFARVNEKRNLTENLLRVTLQRTEDLLIGIGQADHKNKISKFSSEKRFIALMTISAFAIFLHKLGIKKEDYMRSSFFNIGRFLSLVDTLHFEWCRHVRGGYPEEHDEEKWRKAIPPQLLGNAHLRIALENPATAFARLSERLNIYKAWVQKQQPADGNWAHWAIAEIGNISSKIQDTIDDGKFPYSITDIDKTQILLGYLSRSEKKAESDSKSLIEENLENK